MDNEEEIKGTEVNDNQTQGRKGTCCQGQACPLSGAELKIQCYENILSYGTGLGRQCGAEEEPRALQRTLLFSSLRSAWNEKAPNKAWRQGRALSGERAVEIQIGTSISF